jgi:hypothetical protein
MAAGGLLATGVLTSGLSATASAPSSASSAAGRDAVAVRTTTWSTAVDVDGTFGFQLKLRHVPAGDYLATMSGAIVSGKSDLFCALLTPRTERTLLADISVPGPEGVHVIDASRTIHLGVTQDLFVVCTGTVQESYRSPAHFPMQVSLTQVDKLMEKPAKVLRPVKSPTASPGWR